ncbi:MAG: hypothetical protein DMF68_08215 [Acidobacteria bacterium]|nr:MAG: hypothetical protein DMF68_08215 [Acidobacteriota bacterium]
MESLSQKRGTSGASIEEIGSVQMLVEVVQRLTKLAQRHPLSLWLDHRHRQRLLREKLRRRLM